MSSEGNNKSIWQSLLDAFRNSLRRNIKSLEEETLNDVIGNNAKIVIFTLFGLLFATIIMYSILITGKYNPESVFSGIKTDEFGFQSLEKRMYESILKNNTISDSEKLQQIKDFNEQRITDFQDRFQQVEQIDAVFLAAITGAVALGGTLITQLWGRRRQ